MFSNFIDLTYTSYKFMDLKIHFLEFVDLNNIPLHVGGSLVHFTLKRAYLVL